jgi:WD40-like Beta Propeller Repeat
VLLIAALAVAALGLGMSGCGHAAPSAGEPHTVGTPDAAAAAARGFEGHGRLAYVSGDRLYIFDGTAAGEPATLHPVSTGKVPGDLTWSPDGKWLAFLVGSPNADGSVTAGQLWLTGPDGQDAHPVLASSGAFAWSPKADVLAAISGGSLDTIVAGQAPQPVFSTAGLTGTPAWSPNGATIAVSVVHFTASKGFAGSDIELVTSGKGNWAAVTPLARSASDALLVDGWWAGGVFAWSDPLDSQSLAADGVPLVAYSLAGKAVTLPSTLVHPVFAVADANGVTIVTGGDRYLWNAKTFEGCSAAGACGPMIDATPAPVNLDPAWFPLLEDGEPEMAFVHAAPEKTTDFSPAVLAAWYKTRQLWLWHGTGANPYQVAGAGTGIAAPTWSADGKLILYVRDNALWLIDPFGGRVESTPGHPALSGGPAVRVVSDLFAGAWPDYYGYTDWQSQFAWYTGQPTGS